jgi:hypothetical protein
VDRVQQVATQYQGLGGLPAVPAMEIITTVASDSPGADGDYSAESTVAELEPWVDAAQAAGMAVVLDLQPGRATFLQQAKAYERLLERPGVGLALDPEWRLRDGEEPLAQTGSVDVDEVNETSAWLADLVRRHDLPQKLFLVHQFRLSMVRDRARLDTSHDELATVIHVDGHGTPSDKEQTYRAVTADAPAGVAWGWKDFYDEDSPTFSPQQTVDVDPSPSVVTYQ